MDNMEALGEITSVSPADTQQDSSGAAQAGSSAPVAGEQIETVDREEWERLITGPCKAFYTQDTQRIINERFKHCKSLEKQVADAAPVLEALMEHFGLTDGSVDSLRQRLEQERELARREQEQADALAREQVARWQQESEQVAALYPDFQLGRLLADPGFYALVTNPDHPVPLQQAYEATHLDQFRRRQADEIRAQVVDSIRARGTRPDENGASGQSGFTVRPDVGRLSAAALADIRKRVMSGERISFG